MTYWKKDVYERYLRPSNLANSGLRRYATETSTLGVLYPAHSLWCVVSIYLDVGYLELLILRQGNARARRRDERGVEHPRLSHFKSRTILLTAESGGLSAIIRILTFYGNNYEFSKTFKFNYCEFASFLW